MKPASKTILSTNLSLSVRLQTLMLIAICIHQVEAYSTTCGYKRDFSNVSPTGCQLCPENCSECSDSKSCDKCNSERQYFNGQKCVDCKENCRECSSTGECTRCQSNYFLQSGLCLPCSNGCRECTSSTVCTTCNYSYSLDSSLGTCKQCSKGCNECSDSSTCTRCRYNFVLNTQTNQCDSCPENCNCSDISKCDRCEQGFYKQDDGTCKSCSSFNPLCRECKAINKCTSCKSGFYSDSKSNECKTCLSKYGKGCYGGCSEDRCYCNGEGTTFSYGECRGTLEGVFFVLIGIFFLLPCLIMLLIGLFCMMCNSSIFYLYGKSIASKYQTVRSNENIHPAVETNNIRNNWSNDASKNHNMQNKQYV